MARNGNVNDAALETGASMRKADRRSHNAAKPDVAAKRQFAQISGQVKALRRQLQENTEGEPNAARAGAA